MAASSRTSRTPRAVIGISSGTERNSGPSAGALCGRSTMRASTRAMSDGAAPPSSRARAGPRGVRPERAGPAESARLAGPAEP